MAQGTTTINFGAFPGGTDTTVTVTGQAGIGAGSLVEAWIYPTATADHSVDEHWVDPPNVKAGNVVAGTGFTIYGSVSPQDGMSMNESNSLRTIGGDGTVAYGQWTVAWVWN
jgi:hypothetical protein